MDETRALFNRVPRNWISPVGVEFAQKMLELNQERLVSLREALL